MIFGKIERKGFCRGCVQNIRQKRRIRNLFLRCLDYSILRAPALLQIGPWECPFCGDVRLYLSLPVQGVRDFDADQKSDSERDDSGPVGNFIKGEKSLVGQRSNSDRFSMKYRHGIARRLLKGQVTFSQICRELNVHERDLTSWINELVLDQQKNLASEISNMQFKDQNALLEFVESKQADDSNGETTDGGSDSGAKSDRGFPPPPKFSEKSKRPSSFSDDDSSEVIEGKARPVIDR